MIICETHFQRHKSPIKEYPQILHANKLLFGQASHVETVGLNSIHWKVVHVVESKDLTSRHIGFSWNANKTRMKIHSAWENCTQNLI